MLTIRKSTKIRKEEIKRAVLNIIYTEGLGKLSTRNLAEKVGISEGAIFRHFNSKAEIIHAILEDIRKELQDELRRIAIGVEPATERLKKFLFAHIRYLEEHKGITILLFSEATHTNDVKLKAKLNEILAEQKVLVTKIVHDGQVEGVWSEEVSEDDFASLYLGVPLSYNIESVLNHNEIDIDDFCERTYSLLTKALLKKK